MADVTSAVTPIVALDVDKADSALDLVSVLGDRCSFYKVGSELFTAAGPRIVDQLRKRNASVFLDLKLHDIPNTVERAARTAASLGVRLLTVHASGGRPMLEAAVAGAAAGGDCGILAVTVLTSLDTSELSAAWGRGIDNMTEEVLRLAQMASDCGTHGIVCSGQEASAVRSRFGSGLALLVPGVRLGGADRQDQARVVTPRAAAAAGARYIVVGRPVIQALSPATAMEAVLADLS